MELAGLIDLLRYQWLGYWRHLLREGSAAKGNLVLLGLIAAGSLARYVVFLRAVRAEMEGTGFASLELLFAILIVLFLLPAWDDAGLPIRARELGRFPLSLSQRLAHRVLSRCVPPQNWLLLLGAALAFWPLVKSSHPAPAVSAGALLLLTSFAAGLTLAQASRRFLWAGYAAVGLIFATVRFSPALGWRQIIGLLPSHLVVVAAQGAWWPAVLLIVLCAMATAAAAQTLGSMIQAAPPAASTSARSRTMSPLRKELRDWLNSAGERVIWLILLSLAFYLATAHSPEPDALRATLGFTSLLAAERASNLFGSDGAAGLERWGLFPLSSSAILRAKSLAFSLVTATRWIPVLVLGFWRFGAREGIMDSLEAASLMLSTLAWGCVLSVRHPAAPNQSGAERNLLDQLVALAAGAGPAAVAIAAIRASQETAAYVLPAMLAVCAGLCWAGLRWSAVYYEEHFERMREQLS